MTKYSNTRLSTHTQCKRRYKYQYIDYADKDFDNTVEAFMGDLVHRTLEKLYKDLKYEKMNTKEDLERHYLDLWNDEWSDDILIVKSEYEADNYKVKGLKMIQEYYERYHPFDESRTIGLETYYLYDITDEHKYHIRIDRLSRTDEGVYQVRDFKTANSLPPIQHFEEDTQLSGYALGVKEMYPDAEEIELIWHYLAFDKEIRITVTSEMLDRVKAQLQEKVAEVEATTEYTPNKSPLCDYGPFKRQCPLWKHKYDDSDQALSIKEVASTYEQLHTQKKKLESKLEELKKKLSIYMEEEDVKRIFTSSGSSIYRWSKDSIKLPREGEPGYDELVNALKALNLYEEFKELNVWKVQKNIDSLQPWEKEAIKKLGEENVIERFYVHD